MDGNATDRGFTPPDATDAEIDLDIGVIFTYERNFIFPLLETLAASGSELAMRLLLVDNASDGVDEMFGYLPRTEVIRNEERLGYGPNLNRILDASSGRYVLLLNTDMLFDPGEQCLTKMVQFMDATPDCGLASCGIYHPDGAYGYPARRYPTVPMVLARRLPGLNWFGRAARRYLYEERGPEETFDCDWVSGCFMLVRREAYRAVGGLDPRFRKYFEDVDYARMMRQHGWRVMYHGATRCYHLEQRASKRLFSHDARLHMASYIKWLAKWHRLIGGHASSPRRAA